MLAINVHANMKLGDNFYQNTDRVKNFFILFYFIHLFQIEILL